MKEFLAKFKLVSQSANSLITDNLEFFSDKETNKKFAEEYIERLREEQISSIQKSEEGGEYFKMKEFNEINEEILQIRQNKRFKIRPKVWKKSLGGLCQRAARGLKLIFKRHWYKVASIIGAVVTLIVGFYTTKTIIDKMGEAGKEIQKHIDNVHKYLEEKLKAIQGSKYFVTILAGLSSALLYLIRTPILLLSKGVYQIIRFLTSFGIWFWGLFGGLTYLLLDEIRYIGLKLTEKSFLLYGENPPEENTKKIMAIQGWTNATYYEEKYLGPKNQYKPTLLTQTASIAIGAAGKVIEKTGDGAEVTLDFIINKFRYVIYIFSIYLILDILNKWRN